MTTADAGISETATLRKIAWRLLPLIALGYGIAYMDRVNVSFAALQMNRDLGFSATAYGLGGGLFFLSYAALEVPSNMILAKVGARRWIARIMITWGVLAMGMAFVKTPMHFYIMRFLLGAAEAGFFPGVIYYVTLWFPETHRARAITRFYFAVPISAAFMGAVAGSLLSLNGLLGLAGWQWLFLAQGAPALILSAVIFFCLPDKPADAKWLSPAEKAWLIGRLEADAVGRPGDVHNPFRALANPLIAAMVVFNFLSLGSGYAFTLSAPEIVKTATGLSSASVGYIAGAGGLIGAVAMLTNGWLSDRTRERHLFVALPVFLVAAALAVLSLTAAPGAVIAAYLVYTAGNFAAMGLFWSTPGAILHPRSAAVGVAAINSLGQLGSFVIPALWGVAKDATGTYHLGLAVLAADFAVAGGIILVLRARARQQAAG